MADRDVLFRFKGDTSDLDRAVAQATAGLDQFTAEEIAVAKSVKAANKALDDQSKSLGVTTGDLKSARAALKSQAAAQEAAGKAGVKSTNDLRSAQLDFVELLGGPSKDVIGKLTGVMGALGPAALVAGAAIVGAAAGIATAKAIMFDSVLAADDLARSLMEIEGLGVIEGFGIEPAALASLDSANAAIAAVGVAADQAVVIIGGLFAPAVTGLAKGATLLGLAFNDAMIYLKGGEGVMVNLANVAKVYLTEALLAPVSAVELLLHGLSKLASAAGLDTVAEGAAAAASQLGKLKESLGGTSAVVALEAIGTGTVKLAKRTNELTDVMVDHAAKTRDVSSARKDLKTVTEETTTVTIKLTDAEKEKIATDKEAKKAAEDAGKASADLVDEVNKLVGEPVSAVDELRAAYRELDREILRQMEANQKAGISTETMEQARIDLAKGTARELAKIRQAAADAEAKRLDDEKEKQKEYYLSMASLANDAAQSISSALGDVADLFIEKWTSALDETRSKLDAVSEGLAEIADAGINAGALTGDALTQAYLSGKVSLDELSSAQQAQLETRLKAEQTYLAGVEAAQREAAMKAFNLSKAASVSSAIVAGALAVVQALATPLVGPIAKAALVAGVVATTGAQIATIAAEEPTFHSGGFVQAVAAGAAPGRSYAPDEVSTRLQTGEAVLSRVGRSMLGDEQIRRANRGVSATPVVNVTQVYDGQIIGKVVQDQIRSSSALRQSMSTVRPGHRRR